MLMRLRGSIVLLLLTGLTACGSMKVPVIGRTEQYKSTAAVCTVLGNALPTRSTKDTQQTRDEITVLYADFSNACPQQKSMIPK